MSPQRDRGLEKRVRRLLAAAEEGLLVADYNAGPLRDAVREIQQQALWEEVFDDEPKTWERLIREYIDPVHQRVERINAIVDGYDKLRGENRRGRITRRDSEQAVGFHPAASAARPAELQTFGEHVRFEAGTPAEQQLRTLWQKLTPEERQSFLNWLRETEEHREEPVEMTVVPK